MFFWDKVFDSIYFFIFFSFSSLLSSRKELGFFSFMKNRGVHHVYFLPYLDSLALSFHLLLALLTMYTIFLTSLSLSSFFSLFTLLFFLDFSASKRSFLGM